jgi:deoxyribonuclease-4
MDKPASRPRKRSSASPPPPRPGSRGRRVSKERSDGADPIGPATPPGREGREGPVLGAHQSIAGGLVRAVERAVETGCECLQIFTRNINRWDAKPIDPLEAAAFREAVGQAGLHLVVAHDSYLINPASSSPPLRERSIAGLAEELERAETLGIRWVVAHPGSGCGGDADEAVRLAAAGIREALERTAGLEAGVLVETTAGQGSCLGARFEEVGAILRAAEQGERRKAARSGDRKPEAARRTVPSGDPIRGRLGVCLDTCHVFAAGYPLAPAAALEETLDAFDRHVGLDRLVLIHANDSKRECGSRVDRHASIGEGHIGREAFGLLVNHPRLAGIPLILETPKEDADGKVTPAADRRNLAVLRGLVRKNRPSGAESKPAPRRRVTRRKPRRSDVRARPESPGREDR